MDTIADFNDAKAFALKYWTDFPSDREHFVVVNIAEQTVLSTVVIGTLPFRPEDAFACDGADTVVLMHNSSEAMASDRDLLLTTEMTKEAKKRGVFLLDHVIFGGGSVHSMRERITEIMSSPWYAAAN